MGLLNLIAFLIATFIIVSIVSGEQLLPVIIVISLKVHCTCRFLGQLLRVIRRNKAALYDIVHRKTHIAVIHFGQLLQSIGIALQVLFFLEVLHKYHHGLSIISILFKKVLRLLLSFL